MVSEFSYFMCLYRHRFRRWLSSSVRKKRIIRIYAKVVMEQKSHHNRAICLMFETTGKCGKSKNTKAGVGLLFYVNDKTPASAAQTMSTLTKTTEAKLAKLKSWEQVSVKCACVRVSNVKKEWTSRPRLEAAGRCKEHLFIFLRVLFDSFSVFSVKKQRRKWWRRETTTTNAV